jgi:Protein of unknown function (DUF2933)
MSLFLLLILVCPLMMFFMMRGMGGMHGGHDDDARQHGPNYPEGIDAPADPRDQRLADLEREVADLRAAGDHADASRR